MNDNGERLLDFCATNDLVIGGTLFPHKNIHKLTWISPNGRDRNQIDHLIINGTWRHSLLDVKVRRGADVSSDHYLVVASLRVKLRRAGTKKTGRRQFDVQKLNDPKTRSSFILQLRNRFQALADLDDTDREIDEMWEKTKTTFVQTSEECIGYKGKEKKEWISADTWDTIKKRKEGRESGDVPRPPGEEQWKEN
ncbi:uncharacterized protein [Diadema setosum]|uniref:uncharacterized protein n=1 Tax=Diadema setosum TaxID=31175 RepID=UPI003B3A7BC7